MKTFVKILFCSFLVLLSACSSTYTRDASAGEVIRIDVKEFKEKINRKESFALVITRPGCEHCKTFHKMVKEYIKDHNITLYEVYIDEKTTENRKKVVKELQKVFPKLESVPTLYYVEEGIQEDEVVGSIKEDVLDDFVVDHKLDEKQ